MVRAGQTPIEIMLQLNARLVRVVMWLAVFTAHLALALFLVVVLWWFQVTPDSLEKAAVGAVHSALGSNIALVLGFLGVSGTALVYGYVKAWLWLTSKMLSWFVWSE